MKPEELDKIPLPDDLAEGELQGPDEWRETGDGRYSRSYVILDPYAPEEATPHRIWVNGEQFSDGTIERFVVLEGGLMEDGGVMDAQQARVVAAGLRDAADLVGPSVEDAWPNEPDGFEIKLEQRRRVDTAEGHWLIELCGFNQQNANQARELAAKLIAAADEIDRLNGDASPFR